MNRSRFSTRLGMLALLPALIVGCNSSDSADPTDTTDTTETTNDIPQITINASGGIGGNIGASGGDGGYIELYKYGGVGNIEILNSGAADASFTNKTPNANLGANPLEITVDTTIAVTGTEPAAGIAYLADADSSNIYISDGNSILADEDPVTGISIAENVTLTLGLNATTSVYVILHNDIFNQGRITVEQYSITQMGHLNLYPNSYIGTTNSSISTAASLEDQNAGWLGIDASGSIYNHGDLIANTLDSATDAGSADGVGLYASYVVQNTGDIMVNGGHAANGDAGNGGSVDLQSYWGVMENSGNIIANGGNGQWGGGANDIYFYSEIGGVYNSGNIHAYGGNATAGSSGWGGYFDVDNYGGDLISSGDINLSGGDTTDASSSAGAGGYIDFYNSTSGIDETTPAGDILVSGSIDISGGSAAALGTGNGRYGGSIYAEVDNYGFSKGESRIAFLGYSAINASGGDANYPGDADEVYVYNEYAENNYNTCCNDHPYYGAGDIINEADILAIGGSVVANATVVTDVAGGRGAWIGLETEYSLAADSDTLDRVINKGDIANSGGNGLETTSQYNATGGGVWFWGYDGVENTGNILGNGGDDLGTDGGTTGYGGIAYEIDFYAELGGVNNTGDLSNNGGDGEYRGARSYGIELYGAKITNSGDLNSNGGNADAALTASIGGNSGYIELFSPKGASGVDNSGTITATGGTGETAGNDSSIYVAGMCVSDNC